MTVVLAALLGAASAHSSPPRPHEPQSPPLDAEAVAEPRLESIGGRAIPRDVVASMVQDRAGFLWVATGDGVVRYDGYRFRPQERDTPVAAKRNTGWVRAMLPARDGRVWIGTEADGLAVYDPATGRITSAGDAGAVGNGGGEAPVAPPTIVALAEDLDGAIWLGTAAGLLRYDPATGRTVPHLRSSGSGLPDDRIETLLVDRAGALWVGTWQGLSRRARGSERFEPMFAGAAPNLAGRVVRTLFEAADGRVWAGTQQGDVAVIDTATGAARMVEYAGSAAPAGGGAVTSFAQPADGPVWVGRTRGIDLVDPRDGRRLRQLRYDPARPTGLAGNEVSCLLVDRAGWVWIGGFGVGLQRHNPHNRSIRVLDAELRLGGPQDADVRALVHLDNGETWAATHTAGVAVLNRQFVATARVPVPAPERRKSRRPDAEAAPRVAEVEALVQAADGSVWAAADSAVHQYTPDRRHLRSVRHGGGGTLRLLAALDGTLWIATQDGLYRLRRDAAAVERVAQADGQPLRGGVFMLAETPDSAVWVSLPNGLLRIAAGSDTLQAVTSPQGQGLGNPTVLGMLVDSAGTLWIDTAVTGLHRLRGWDGAQARFDRVSERHGALGRPFGVNLLEDSRGRIWTHMYVYDPAADRLHELTPADGVTHGTGWFRSYARTADGRLLFGGSKGLLVVRPEAFDPPSAKPPLVVSELLVNGRPTPAGLPVRLRLAPQDRSFSVEFAALDYSEPRRIRYAYQLRGHDPDWIAASADTRIAAYGNLRPGDYELRVRASNRSGAWSADELSIPVTVVPAWWQARWFHLALLPFGVTAVWGLVRFRTRLLRRRQQQLEEKVRTRTSELEEVSAALRQKSAALAESSLSDPLTGLHNRRFVTENLDHDLAQTIRRHESRLRRGAPLADDADMAFFLLDLDHFKQLNDGHGHAAGDAVLMQMRGRLQQVFRAGDYLVRWGGEEFLIVALGTSRAHAPVLAERARASVADRPFDLGNGKTLRVTCSIGFACFPPSPAYPRALDWKTVVNLADAALYRVKRGGRNGWLGIVGARAESEAALRAAAQQPFDDWRASGGLEVTASRRAAPEAAVAQRAPG